MGESKRDTSEARGWNQGKSCYDIFEEIVVVRTDTLRYQIFRITMIILKLISSLMSAYFAGIRYDVEFKSYDQYIE